MAENEKVTIGYKNVDSFDQVVLSLLIDEGYVNDQEIKSMVNVNQKPKGL